MTRFERRPSNVVYAAAAAIAACVLLADRFTELGIAAWVFYLVPVAVTQFGWRPLAPFVAAGVCSLLLVVGYDLSAPGSMPVGIAQANRAMGAITLWVVAAMAWRSVVAKIAVAEDEWLNAAQARLAERLEGDLTAAQVAEKALRLVVELLEAAGGAIYAVALDGRASRLAAFAAAADAPATFGRGESLVGQAALEKRLLHLKAVPEGYFRVTSAHGARAPREIAVVPAVADGATVAVLELSFLQAMGGSDRDLLAQVARPIAVALRSAEYRARLQELLAETQRQAEELQAQGEELRVQNEELQEQGEALRETQARLEAQQAELELTNAELETQANELEQQRDAVTESRRELQRKAAEVERASRYKSEFLANMSHELRTPLNSILILAKLLAERQGDLGPDRVRYARSISSAGNDLLSLINDVLDLSKIEAGRLEIRLGRVELARLLEDLERTFSPVAAERKLGFERVVEPGAPVEIESDPQRLQQILANLLSNAFKFTEQGGVTLRVAPAGPGRVALAVRDTGIGIAPEQHELVFEAFRQVDTGSSRKYGGTGLGLSISRDLARLLGGELALESAPGQGSTFTLTLPVRAEARARTGTPMTPTATATATATPTPTATATATPTPTPTATATATRRNGARTVLVVEDDPQFAQVVSELARSLEFEPVVAATAGEALAKAAEARPSAVVLDVGLPDESGLTVLERLKRDPSTRHLPVHVVSGRDHARTALELGAVGHARKPVTREDLEAVFRRLDAQLQRRTRRVLVVEDDAVQREAMTKLLGGSDVEIVAVETLAGALEQLAAATFDCMVVDLALPDGSGFDLLERLESGERPFPPVIVYTGRSLDRAEEERLRRHSDAVILKGARSPERLLDEVTLFLHRVEADLPKDRRRMLQEARGRDGALEGRRLLVVEDDVRTVFALASVFEPRGATVAIARNGREALEALARDPLPDLVLMDIMMPEMDGHEAMRRMRADPRLAKLPVIALTARAGPDDGERCLAAGANDYLAKPIDVDKLLSLVRVWLPR